MRQVMVCDPSTEQLPSIGSALEGQGFQILSCADGNALLEQVVQHRPAVVVYGLRPSGQEDMGVLQLLRRVAPDLPLVLVAAEESLVTQKLVQDLRPIYYAVRPLDAAELIEAVRAALARRHRAGV